MLSMQSFNCCPGLSTVMLEPGSQLSRIETFHVRRRPMASSISIPPSHPAILQYGGILNWTDLQRPDFSLASICIPSLVRAAVVQCMTIEDVISSNL
jgi:hypothetical protein